MSDPLKNIGDIVARQAKDALAEMVDVSADVAEKAAAVVAQMVDAGEAVSNGTLSPEDGDVAIKNYLHALQLYQQSITNKAKAEAYSRAQRFLEGSSSILFSALKMGLQAGAPHVSEALEGMRKFSEELKSS